MRIKYFSIIGLAFLLIVSCQNNTKTDTINEKENTEAHGQDAHDEGEEHAKEIEVSEAQMKAVNIELGKIELRNLNSVVRVNGQLALDPQKRAEVTSLVGGIVRKILVIEGSQVSAGQTVAYLENTEIVELQKNYLIQKKEAIVAEQDFLRQKELLAQGAGVEKTMQQASAKYEISKAQLVGSEQQLRQLSISPERVSTGNLVTQIPIKAPISGVVGKVNVSTGSYVDQQTSMMNIADNTASHCDMKVFEKDIAKIKIGQEVDITLTNQPGVQLKGTTYGIGKSFTDDSKSMLVHVALKGKSDAKLMPGMYVSGLINVGMQKTEAVPNEAIVSKDGKKYIFVLEDEVNEKEGKSYHFAQVEVVAGISELGYTQITPIAEIEKDATIVKSNAFYISSMSSEHGEHGH